MLRIKLTICFSFIWLLSFSQTEHEILANVLYRYKMELPRLEKRALKELKILDKRQPWSKNWKSNNYQFTFIPMFKLKKEYTQYLGGDSFAKYIDFDKMHDDFEAFVFVDTIFNGSLHLSDYDNSYFSIHDTSKYNKAAFMGNLNLAQQIQKFKPDMIFYPDCALFICFIKDGKLYIGRETKQLQPFDYIFPFDEFILKSPRFIKELEANKNLELKHYLKLRNKP